MWCFSADVPEERLGFEDSWKEEKLWIKLIQEVSQTGNTIPDCFSHLRFCIIRSQRTSCCWRKTLCCPESNSLTLDWPIKSKQEWSSKTYLERQSLSVRGGQCVDHCLVGLQPKKKPLSLSSFWHFSTRDCQLWAAGPGSGHVECRRHHLHPVSQTHGCCYRVFFLHCTAQLEVNASLL